MMKTKKLLFTAFSTLFVLISVNAASAENGLIYPPADDSRIFDYPPQNTMAATNNRMPNVPINGVGNMYPNVPNYQQPMMAQPRTMPGYRPGMQAPYGMQNRNYPVYPSYNNRQRNPFGNNMNMPFGNNSGNNFNPFSGNNMPFFNNSGNNFNPFSGGNFPFSNNSGNPMSNMFGNNNNNRMPFFKESKKNRKKAWGDERHIWPDFYTDFTDDAWDSVSSGPRDLGRMPGGWRFPHISTPDPVTVSDAITNQFPPIAEEAGNMLDISEWGVFDEK